MLSRMGLIETNPLHSWTYFKADSLKETDDVDPFSREEQERILANLQGQERNLAQFAFWTGLHTSELVALNWSDIDFLNREIRVTKALTQAAKKPEATKTRKGRRIVKLLEPALIAVTQQKKYTFLNYAEVFQNPRTKKRWSGDQPIRKTMWKPAVNRAGVRYRRPYQTRHTYASMLLSADEYVMWVAKQMGHRDWIMTARIYSRWMPSANPDNRFFLVVR